MEAPLLEPDQTEQSMQRAEPEPKVCLDIRSSTLLQHSLPLPDTADFLYGISICKNPLCSAALLIWCCHSAGFSMALSEHLDKAVNA